LVGIIILVAVAIMCVVFSMINGKKMAQFKEEVERQYMEAKNSSNDSAPVAAPTVDSPFVISTALSFKTKEGAKEYEEAFKVLAKSRQEFASTYLLTQVRGCAADDHVKYIEFIVFRSSEAFRQHRLTVSEGTTQMQQAMEDHVVLDKVAISALGNIDPQEKLC